MKRTFWPYMMMSLLAVACVLLLWNGYQSTQTLRAARAELTAARSQLEQQRLQQEQTRLQNELEVTKQAQALADEKVNTLVEVYGLPQGIFDEKTGPRDFLLYRGRPFDPTLDVQFLETEQTFTAQQAAAYTDFYHVWEAGEYKGIRVGEAGEGSAWVNGLSTDVYSDPATVGSPTWREQPDNNMLAHHGPAVPGLTFVPEGMIDHTYLEYCALDLGGDYGQVILAAVQDQETYRSQLALYRQQYGDEDYVLLGIIATMDDGRWLGREELPLYLSIRDVTPFDLDGDGRAELITEPPRALRETIFITGYDGQTLTRAHDIQWALGDDG